MVASPRQDSQPTPFTLLVSGEAGEYVDALDKIIGPVWLATYRVRTDREILQLVQSGLPDALVLDEEAMDLDPLRLLRMIRRLNQALLVVLVTGRRDRRWLEEALRLTAFSVVSKPLGLEEMLLQIHRMMVRLDVLIRRARL